MGMGIGLSPGATLLSPPLADLTPKRRIPQVYCQTLQLEHTGGQGHRQAPIDRFHCWALSNGAMVRKAAWTRVR